MGDKIKVAIVGIGNCANSLVSGIQYTTMGSVLCFPRNAGFLMFVCGIAVAAAVIAGMSCASAEPQDPPREAVAVPGGHWSASDRAARALALRPGARLPDLTPETLFADWTRQQVERWEKEHPGETLASAFARYAAAEPSDRELTDDFPAHISPFARVRSGEVPQEADDFTTRFAFAFTGPNPCYCPLCGSRTTTLWFDPANRYHATTTCCRRELYGRQRDYPPGYDLKPNSSARFEHLDGTVKESPCVVYKDANGVEWELFIPTVFAYKRWLDLNAMVVLKSTEFLA